jgi:hypothetical protein
VADDFAAAVIAGRGQRVYCTLEAVEDVRGTRRDQLEGLVVLVAAASLSPTQNPVAKKFFLQSSNFQQSVEHKH